MSSTSSILLTNVSELINLGDIDDFVDFVDLVDLIATLVMHPPSLKLSEGGCVTRK